MEGGKSPATRNRTRDHLIAATLYSQMLYQLSYSRICLQTYTGASLHWDPIAIWAALKTDQPRHEARVDVRTISRVAWSTGPRFDWAVYVCVRACVCVCVFACVAASVSFSFQCRRLQNRRNDKIELLPGFRASCIPCDSGLRGGEWVRLAIGISAVPK